MDELVAARRIAPLLKRCLKHLEKAQHQYNVGDDCELSIFSVLRVFCALPHLCEWAASCKAMQRCHAAESLAVLAEMLSKGELPPMLLGFDPAVDEALVTLAACATGKHAERTVERLRVAAGIEAAPPEVVAEARAGG